MPPGSRARRPPSPRSSRMRRLLWRGRRTLAVERLHLLDHVMVLQENRSIRPRGERVLVARGGNAGVRSRDRRSVRLSLLVVVHRVLLDESPDWVRRLVHRAGSLKDAGRCAHIPWYGFERRVPRAVSDRLQLPTLSCFHRGPPASTSAASFASDDRQPASLSAAGTPRGSPSCTARRSVPPSASASAIVIVISPSSAGSVASNSTTSTTCSLGTSFTKRVGLSCRLAGAGRGVVRERDPERAAFAGVERM